MSTCPQCGKTVQPGVTLCPYCKVNMHTIRRSDLRRPEARSESASAPEGQFAHKRAQHQGPERERNLRSAGEKRPGPDGLSIGRLTGVLFTSAYRK